MTLLTKDGKAIPFEYRASVLPDPAGEPRWCIAIGRDMTEHKRTEAALRESQEEYRSLFQSVQVGLVVHAPDTRILFSNPMASQLLGLTPDQMRGKTAIDSDWCFVREDETPMPLEEYPVNQVLATHQPLTNLTLGILRADREGLTWVQCNAHQDWDIDGNLLRVVVTFADITERKRSEKALRETHHRLEKVLDVETVGIMFWDFSSGRLVDANDTFLKTLGYSRHELQSGELTWQRFTPPEYHERSLAQLERFRKLGRIGPYEKEYLHKDGTRQWFIFAGSSLGGDECVEFCVDISDRKRAEQNLRATEQRLRIEKDFVEKLFDVTEDTIFVFEPDTGKPVRWNNACRKITGYSDEEIASLKFPDTYYSQEELALADEAIQRGYRDGTGTVELTLLTKDGKAIPFEYSGSLVPTQEGEPRRFISIGRDITERKQAEQARQQREALFRAVVENTYDGIVLFKNDRRIVYVSPSHKRVSGYSPEDALGSDAISYLHPDDQAHAVEVLSNISRQPGQSMSLEYRLRHKLGHWVWIEANVTNLLDDPYVNAFVVNGRDITGRKQAEAELQEKLTELQQWYEAMLTREARVLELKQEVDTLRQRLGEPPRYTQELAIELPVESIANATEVPKSERSALLSVLNDERRAQDALRQFALAIEQSPESVVITNLDAEIEYVNAAFMANSGYGRDLVTSQNPRILHSGQTPLTTYEAMWATLTAGKSWQGELINRKANGEDYIEYAIITPLRQPDGRITHYVAVKQDITERKRIEAELARASRTKGEFLANMSHEIRTPMNAILGLTQILEREILSPDHQDLLHKISEAGTALLRIINDILDFSKIEAGQFQIDSAPFTLAAVLTHMQDLLTVSAQKKGLTLSIQGGDLIEEPLVGDALRIEQILTNLIGNAIKFTTEGRVDVKVTLLETNGQTVRLRFAVTDTGVGITPEQQEKLFQPFSQGDASTTRRFGGTGLGLSICKRLVELMGGTIGVTSTNGEGSTFWFELPLRRTTESLAQPAPATTEPGPRLTGLRVLAVDDVRINLFMLQRALQLEGATVTLAADGQQALNILRASPQAFDVVLMDIQMPVMDGLTATREIRKEPSLAQLPVIALTAGVLAEERQAALDAGVNDFLAKPLDLQQMNATLAQYLVA